MHRLRDGLAVVSVGSGHGVRRSAAVKAANLEEAVAHFTDDDFSETDAGISAVAESGDPRAAAIIEALQDGRLQFSAEQKKVFYKDADGKLHRRGDRHRRRGRPARPISRPVRINNRLRRSIDAAIGGLTLLSPDPAKRYDAAQAVFKSREQNALPALEAAHRQGKRFPHQDRRCEQARAAIILNSSDASEADKLDAVAVIRGRGDQDAVALLSALPADTPAAVAQAGRGGGRLDLQRASLCGTCCRTSGTASRSARCCCSPRSGSPSPSA